MKFLRNVLRMLCAILLLSYVGYVIIYFIEKHQNPAKYEVMSSNPLITVSIFVGSLLLVCLIGLWLIRGYMRKHNISELSKKELEQGLIWKARRRNWLGLPWTFTLYLLDKDRLYIRTGFFNSQEDEVRLYRIVDVTLHRNLWQKLIGVGTLHCDSSDTTLTNFDVVNIRHAREVKQMMSKLIDDSRIRNKVYASESNMSIPHHHEGDMPPVAELDMTDADRNGIPDTLEQS